MYSRKLSRFYCVVGRPLICLQNQNCQWNRMFDLFMVANEMALYEIEIIHKIEICLHFLTFNNHVNVESLYGTNVELSLVFPEAWSANLEMTKPNVVKDLKIKSRNRFKDTQTYSLWKCWHIFIQKFDI